ncbi:helix-turn-helix transcriptional regulator [Aestuariibacter sp. GS-14]|uniref:helix-turn-helix domain-containing protein n=1 Tax=Aestuariibacter sp. GS-14 TaxID=2590670 RepID=UPI0011289837|nr:helix-turn-helix transcriptional regulator [Aestuariibacter sp. GS-14]TPV55763.1 helix-turn-helix transcriptional regulator [Aestuariibacter sp. GS-14]
MKYTVGYFDGDMLKEKRKQRGWTQAYVSERTGLSKPQIIKIEKGLFSGGIKYLRKYLELLDLEITITEKRNEVPQLDELAELFGDD